MVPQTTFIIVAGSNFVALYHNQEPVVGIIYEIGQRECFYTWKGGKAFMNNRNISVSSSNSIKESLLLQVSRIMITAE
jgi:fructose-1,6-bisphosphatase/inositol monophosphatase family enzyme